MIKEVCHFIASVWEVDFDAGANEPNIGDRVSTPSDANFFIVKYTLTGGAWGALGTGKLWIRKPGQITCGWLDNDVITNNTQANQLATCEFTIGTLAVNLTVGTDLFVGHRPQGTVDACDVVIETAGGSVFFSLPERTDLVFQVLSRDTTYFTARARAYAIYDAIFRDHIYGSAGWTLPNIVGENYEAMVIEPLAPPQYIGQDKKSRYEFSTNYLMKIKKL